MKNKNSKNALSILRPGNTITILAVILTIHLTLLSFTRFTAWPEMTLWPYLLTKGWLPYQDIAIAHTPLLITVLATFYKFFGVGIIQLKLFTIVIILVTDLIIYYVTYRLWNIKRAILITFSYIFLQIFYEGNGLWFDIAFTPLILVSYYAIQTKKYFLSGIFWGLALITKQTAIWFLFPIAFALFTIKVKNRQVLLDFFYGTLVTLFIFVTLLLFFGLLDDFWFWAVKFGIFYLPQADGQVQLPSIRQFVVYLLPFTPLLLTPSFIPWVLAGIMGVYPRWELFHFQPGLPFLAMSIGLMFTNSNFKLVKNYVIAVYFLFMLLLVGRHLTRDFGKETRFYESDVQVVTSSINNQPSKIDNLFILNYWDNIYALTDTLPTTKPWFPYLPWYLGVSGVRNEILGDLKADLPDIIVVAVEPSYDWKEMDDILKYYSCSSMSEKINLCQKN